MCRSGLLLVHYNTNFIMQLYNLHLIVSKLELHADNALLSVGPSTQHESSLASFFALCDSRTAR